MKNFAFSGKKAGYMSLRNEHVEKDEDEEEYEDNDYILSRLDELLLREELEREDHDGEDHMRIYKWLVKEVDKTDIFKDIHINLNMEKFQLDFFWD